MVHGVFTADICSFNILMSGLFLLLRVLVWIPGPTARVGAGCRELQTDQD